MVPDRCFSGSNWFCTAVLSFAWRVFGGGMVFLLVGFVHSSRCVVFSSAWPGGVRVGVRCGFCACVPGSARAMRAYCFARCVEDSRKSICISFMIVAGSSLAQAPSDTWCFCCGVTFVAFRHLRRAWWRSRWWIAGRLIAVGSGSMGLVFRFL